MKAVWEVAGSGTASTNDVSVRLSVSSASVTNMLKRLQEMGLVEYERYKGASLTEVGRAEALRLLRRHRLIEAFLLEHLGYSWQDVHEEAERLEHAVSDEFTERLAEMLGHPSRDPHGDLIPAADGTMPAEEARPLDEASAGSRAEIVQVSDEDPEILNYLGERGLVPGCVVTVEESRPFDGVVTILVEEDGGSFALGAALAGAILVHPVPSESRDG